MWVAVVSVGCEGGDQGHLEGGVQPFAGTRELVLCFILNSKGGGDAWDTLQ
jgi:hypothetical protein